MDDVNNEMSEWDTDMFEWIKWNFAEDGFKLEKTLKRPRRQTRAGIASGLSVLLDPHLSEYFCPSTDSEGFRMALQSSVDFPPMQSKGKVVPIGKEIFLSVEPNMMVTDENVQKFPFVSS